MDVIYRHDSLLGNLLNNSCSSGQAGSVVNHKDPGTTSLGSSCASTIYKLHDLGKVSGIPLL